MATKSKPQTRYSPLEAEQTAFEAMLDDLMPEHAGHFVIIKDRNPVGFYPTFADAHKAALEKFGLSEVYLISEVKRRGLETPSISWATGVMFGQG